jgi:Met-zincin/Domain of unknown function (DUF5117)/Domain of unknown function (DUF5118)
MKAFAMQPKFTLKLLSAAVLFTLSGASFAQDAAPANAAAGAAPKAAAAPAAAEKPDPSALKPFNEVIKGAKEIKGFFTLHQKDEKVWIEIKPEQLNAPFFFSVNTPNSLGERGLYAGQMGDSHMVLFKRIGNTIQLIAKNTEFVAQPGTPQALVVAQGFSDSLLSSAAVVSAPHGDSKAFLVEANALLFADIPGYSTNLEFAYRMPFTLDARNSSFTKVRADENLTGFLVSAHFSVPRLAARPLVPPPPPAVLPPPPSSIPDPRSAFVGFYYSFAALPKTVMQPRVADDRVGHFITTKQDSTEDLSPNTANHFVNRWRLEKQDPSAALSPPVTPITYWLDKNVPEKYRKSVIEGVLEWNKAFEKIGFKDAIVVKQQTEADDFDTLDANHASIRWFTGADVGFAIGPSHVDPRSGEIVDADIGMSDVFSRGVRRAVAEDNSMSGLTSLFKKSVGDDAGHFAEGHKKHKHSECNYASGVQQEIGFAFDLLEARGDFEMDSPKAEKLAQAFVKDVMMHEIGHTLGLRHNFRASTIYTPKQLQDTDFTSKNGITGSVMDYTPLNLAAKGEKQGEYVMSTLGPYDYWAIEYAYRPLDPASEKVELAKIAGRSTEPYLAFATDEDSRNFMSDPEVNLFDLGVDPLAYFKKRIQLSRELWDRLQSKQVKPGEDYGALRRSYESGFREFFRSVPTAAKFVGGVISLRDHAGTGRPTFAPIEVTRQREALNLLIDNLFKSDSLKLTPELVSRLGSDRFQRQARPDVSLAQRFLAIQGATLEHLMSDPVAIRLLDSQEKVSDSKKVLALSELLDTVQTAVWSELKGNKEITGMRRNLQREHLKRVANTLLRPSAATPADARSLQRMNALALQNEIRVAMAKPMSKESKAHLTDCFNTLSEALKAPLIRAGV